MMRAIDAYISQVLEHSGPSLSRDINGRQYEPFLMPRDVMDAIAWRAVEVHSAELVIVQDA